MALLARQRRHWRGHAVSGVTTDAARRAPRLSSRHRRLSEQSGSLVVSSISTGDPATLNVPVASATVILNEPAGVGFFGTDRADSLTDNGGPNLITSAVSVTLVSGSTYSIRGLSALTTAEGSYTLTVNAADILDPDGDTGTGMLSTSWLMDTTPPASTRELAPD